MVINKKYLWKSTRTNMVYFLCIDTLFLKVRECIEFIYCQYTLAVGRVTSNTLPLWKKEWPYCHWRCGHHCIWWVFVQQQWLTLSLIKQTTVKNASGWFTIVQSFVNWFQQSWTSKYSHLKSEAISITVTPIFPFWPDRYFDCQSRYLL